ncbi:Cytochrome C biogenesis protein transmembrane region [uncultured archaeon]|nr:Cytochrome C biogenesis protein transmembrane region [uncultured archaeon]
MTPISLIIAFAAGLLSFLSPCVLPILPGFLGYLSGVSAMGAAPKVAQKAPQGRTRSSEAKSVSPPASAPMPRTRWQMFLHSVFFVLGFSIAFAVLGVLLSGVLAPAGAVVRLWLSRVGGLFIIFFGLFTLGVVRIPFLESEHKLNPMHTRYQYLTSMVFGATFAVGWSPCVGAVLGSILTLAATDAGGALGPMLAYAAGLAVPFLLVGALGSEALGVLKRFRGFLPYFNAVAGILLIILGVLVATQQLVALANFIIPQALLATLNGGGL